MIKMTDGKRTVSIEMYVWNGSSYGEDWSHDFFEVGGLPYHEDDQSDNRIYHVDDVDYCLEQAEDWMNRRGDFYYDDSDDERQVFVEEA